MDCKKICFIMCVNDWNYANEAIYFIKKLIVPEGYTIDVLTVEDATSMTAGYNEAMRTSDAKYKVYLHQDVMIVEQNFIAKMLDIFRNDKVGMIGMVGAVSLDESKVMWNCRRVGSIYNGNAYGMKEWLIGKVDAAYQSVEAIDGLLMATQYDISWREDIFKRWDFYDASQSFGFRKAGYEVVVPHMDKPWCIHDDGFMDLKYYYEERDKFVREYC